MTEPISDAMNHSTNTKAPTALLLPLACHLLAMSKSCFLAVYSDLVGSFWTGEFELNKTAGHLRKEVFDDSLQGLLPAGTSSSQLGLYYVVRPIASDVYHWLLIRT